MRASFALKLMASVRRVNGPTATSTNVQLLGPARPSPDEATALEISCSGRARVAAGRDAALTTLGCALLNSAAGWGQLLHCGTIFMKIFTKLSRNFHETSRNFMCSVTEACMLHKTAWTQTTRAVHVDESAADESAVDESAAPAQYTAAMIRTGDNCGEISLPGRLRATRIGPTRRTTRGIHLRLPPKAWYAC